MNNIKRVFSIKDLENLSGIKAHTIRIWEKRYNLLSPHRTDTNIRTYSIKSLQKLLNITLLYNNGYKISKIAGFTDAQIIKLVKDLISENAIKSQAINDLKLSMVNFNPTLFTKTYKNLIAHKTFSEIFYDVFVPLLYELGLLWQTETITPAHEHFISNLIKQKILINTETLQETVSTDKNTTFVLFLPEHEIHEIGLLFLNHEIVKNGYHTIYLGPSMPLEDLADLNSYYPEITFITYFTVTPSFENIPDYLVRFNNLVNYKKKNKLWLLGNKISELDLDQLPENMCTFTGVSDLVKKL
ncbi:MerR family transcriptional regulator [Neptunitalea chrysea]|uniref:MerR family transcriptional regulator n=1 Tax=Neptunitalea chrysea TaxID=1647581 RepID=A0A9W6EW06_9FLAO|nr:MerR family transcriptional regulator [Neptunitalea chrysea]GLB52238.1 MerR family transcriptional regulator [Neptunitalea chrysea]